MKKKNLIKLLFIAMSPLLLMGCNSSEPADLMGAINHPDRKAGDSENDERRKAAETLAFFGIAPSMTVFEVEAGGGYFTELMSRVVGPNGKVVTQTPEIFLAFYSEEIKARFADNRLSNVRQTLSLFDALDAEDDSIDLVTWVLGPHELYFVPDDGSSLGDPEVAFAEIFRITKPGGIYVVIDHAAMDGAPNTTGGTLHRIDPKIVIELAEAAGFELEKSADFLANPEDNDTLIVFAPAVRGHTDQFALRFRKPK